MVGGKGQKRKIEPNLNSSYQICHWCNTPMEEFAPVFDDGSYTREIDYRCENKECTGPLITGEQVLLYLFHKYKNRYHVMFCSSHFPPYEIWTHEVQELQDSTQYHKVTFTGETWKECVAKASKYEQEVSNGTILRQSDRDLRAAQSIRKEDK